MTTFFQNENEKILRAGKTMHASDPSSQETEASGAP